MIRRNTIVVALLLAVALPAFAGPEPRFYFAGEGRLKLHHAHFNTALDVRYRRKDGSYDTDALAAIDRFFRSREDGREAPVSLRLIELLAYIQDRFRPRQMFLLSGYRSPQFNADLRAAGGKVANASLHTEALAADVLFKGTDMSRLWKRLRDLRTGGVGYYRANNFLHIDTGPPRFWEAKTSKVDQNLSAGNARIFVRTDFDRYSRIEGAVCDLHSVTAFPVRVASQAALVAGSHRWNVELRRTDDSPPDADGCYVMTAPTAHALFRVAHTEEVTARHQRFQLALRTCEPRIDSTPTEMLSNPIEIGVAGLR